MNIVSDPFLTVLPAADAGALAEKDRERFEAICTEVEQMADVLEARQAYETATDRTAKLKAAHVAMNRRGKELVERVATAKERLESGLIEQYANSGEPVDAAALFAEYSVARGESGALSFALAKLVEHITPLAAIAQLDGEERLFSVRAKRFRSIADERVKHTSELMRDVAEFEGGVTIDVRTGLTGFILTYVEMLEGRSGEAFQRAREQERAYMRANAPRL